MAVLLYVASCAWGQVGSAPQGVLINTRSTAFNAANGKTYVLDCLGKAIWVLDGKTLSAKRVAVGGGPTALVVSEANGNAYAALKDTGEVVVVDGKRDQVIKRVKVGPRPYSLAIDDRRGRLYAGGTTSAVFATIATGSNAVDLEANFGSADQLAVDMKTGKVFAIEYESPNLKIYDPNTKRTERVPVGEHLWGLAVSARTGTAYVTRMGADEVVAVDEQSRATRVVHTGKIPCALEIDEAAHRMFVLQYGDDSLSMVDTDSLTTVGTVKVGKRPQALRLDHRNRTVAVASVADGSVMLVDAVTGRVLSTRVGGTHPYGIEISGDPNVIYSANFTSTDSGLAAWTAVPLDLPARR